MHTHTRSHTHTTGNKQLKGTSFFMELKRRTRAGKNEPPKVGQHLSRSRSLRQCIDNHASLPTSYPSRTTTIPIFLSLSSVCECMRNKIRLPSFFSELKTFTPWDPASVFQPLHGIFCLFCPAGRASDGLTAWIYKTFPQRGGVRGGILLVGTPPSSQRDWVADRDRIKTFETPPHFITSTSLARLFTFFDYHSVSNHFKNT